MGGSAIFRVKPGDPNISVILETLTRNGCETIMAQKFIPQIEKGDKRILMINGEPVPYCLAREGHVRVDVLSERLPPTYLRRADLVALVVFLIPVFGLMIWAFLPDLRFSWAIREGAVETGGLGGVWLVKTMVVVAGALMILQGIAAVLRPGSEPQS